MSFVNQNRLTGREPGEGGGCDHYFFSIFPKLFLFATIPSLPYNFFSISLVSVVVLNYKVMNSYTVVNFGILL